MTNVNEPLPGDEHKNAETQSDNSGSTKTKKGISLDWIQSFFLRASLVVSVIVVILFIVRELTDKSFAIQPFSLPEDLAQNGYNGEVMAGKVLTNLNDMIVRANERRTLNELDEYNNASDRIQVKMEVSGVAISPEAISSYLKQIFGVNPRTISGAIIHHEKSLELILSISGRPKKSITEKLDSISIHDALENISVKAAEEVLKAHNRLLAGLYFYSKEDGPNAIENFRASVFEQPDLASKAYTHWGDAVLVLTEDTVGASRLLRKALEINPREGAAYRILGTMYTAMDMPDKAEAHYRKSLEIDPTSAHTWSHLANRVLLEDSTREDEALQALQNAFELNHLFEIDLTVLLYLRGDYQEAYEKLQWVRYLEPNRGYALSVAIFEALKDTAQAAYIMESAPDKSRIAEGLAQLSFEQALRKKYKIAFRLAKLSLQADDSEDANQTYALIAGLCALTSNPEGFYSHIEMAMKFGLPEDDVAEFEERGLFGKMTSEERYMKLKEKYF